MTRPFCSFVVVFCACATAPDVAPPPAGTADSPAKPKFYVVEPGIHWMFHEERAAFADRIEAWARQRGHDVVPLSRVREVFAAAHEGKHPETGAACGMSLRRDQAEDRWRQLLGHDATLRTSAWCPEDEGCRLTVSGFSRESGEELFELRAPLTPGA